MPDFSFLFSIQQTHTCQKQLQRWTDSLCPGGCPPGTTPTASCQLPLDLTQRSCRSAGSLLCRWGPPPMAPPPGAWSGVLGFPGGWDKARAHEVEESCHVHHCRHRQKNWRAPQRHKRTQAIKWITFLFLDKFTLFGMNGSTIRPICRIEIWRHTDVSGGNDASDREQKLEMHPLLPAARGGKVENKEEMPVKWLSWTGHVS